MKSSLVLSLLMAGLAMPAAAATECRPATEIEASVYSNPVFMPGIISPKDGTCFLNDVWITASDGKRLKANIFLPPGAKPHTEGDLPGIVFIASWGSAEFFEYLGAQHMFARHGYASMAYTTRGFWNSEGTVGVAAPIDVADVSSAIDHFLDWAPVSDKRIGVSGISYGAGLGLLILPHDRRVAAVSVMSGWADLVEQLFNQQAANTTWTKFLVGAGKMLGRLDPIVERYAAMLDDVNMTQAQIKEVIDWTRVRSPSTYIDEIKASGVPVMMVKNYHDHMFTPNSSMALFEQLTQPKLLMLQSGVHSGAELDTAVFGNPTPVYETTRKWFDHWLKGIDNGIEAGPQLLVQPQFQKAYETLSSWPAAELKTHRLYLSPRGDLRWDWGCFCFKGETGQMSRHMPSGGGADRINNLVDTTATTGALPILSTSLEAQGLKITNVMGSILHPNGIRYASEAFPRGTQLRGIPKMHFKVRPSQSRSMLVGYLYDVAPNGIGTLITHAAHAIRFVKPNGVYDFDMELNAAAYDVPAGHHLELVFDTQDHLYKSANPFGQRLDIDLITGDGDAWFEFQSR